MNNIFQSAVEVRQTLPRGKKFTLVGGCFDLIHVGHVHLLEYAASLEELLVVAVLSDSYTQKYKDPLRPVINQKQRLKMIASIRCVDFSYISNVSPNGLETLGLLKPHSVVFDEESRNTEKMRQRMENIESASPHTKVIFLPRYNEEEISTGRIISRIRAATTSE
jgi:cytidyltransferase-like protein